MNRKAYLLILSSCGFLSAQNESDEKALLRISQGISFSQDSSFLLNLRFRLQNRFGYLTTLDDTAVAGFDVRVRRLRLRLDGFALTPRLSYYVQLSFAASDQDFVPQYALNIVRDAMIYYAFSPHFYIGMGQSKLPGNRQRVISSGNLQLPERSYANQFYTLDRDVGIFLYQSFSLGRSKIHLKGALTAGEGRLSLPTNTALAYTARIEYLPWGAFRNNGDYSEGDLEFEPTPRLAIGLTYSFNERAMRIGGQLGRPLATPVNLQTWIADAILKWKGWCFSGEGFYRTVHPYNQTDRLHLFIYSGLAWNAQLSKTLRSFHEVCLRYTEVKPPPSKRVYQAAWRTYGVGYTKYFNGHRIKAQVYVGWDSRTATLQAFGFQDRTVVLSQVEFGI